MNEHVVNDMPYDPDGGYGRFLAKHGWSGSTLKLIAVVSMFIDHLGAGILERYMVQFPGEALLGIDAGTLRIVDAVFRGIGRLAFPLYCFLLVEGFGRTRNVWKYLLRLLLFGIISEVPFDMCFYGTPLYWNYQNVFFTLAQGLLMLILLQKADGITNLPAKLVLSVGTVTLFAVTATLLRTDYVFGGIFTILLLYAGRKTRKGTLIAHFLSCMLILYELPAVADLVPLAMYNGRRGLKMKYFFYAFYPAHLLLIWGLGRCLGLG